MKDFLFKSTPSLCLALAIGVLSGCGTTPTESYNPGKTVVRWFTRSTDEEAQPSGQESTPPKVIRQASINQSGQVDDYHRALGFYRQRRFREALVSVEKSIQYSPRSFSSHCLKGDCLYELLKFDEAIKAYKIALQLKPSYYPALRGLGFVYLNQGNQQFQQGRSLRASNYYQNSLKNLREAMRRHQGDLRTAYGRAFAAEGMGRFNYDRAVNLQASGDNQGAETMYDRCMKFSREAIDMVSIYQRGHPTEIEPQALAGRVSLRMAMLDHEFGRRQQAEIYLQKAISSWQNILTGKQIDNPTARAEVERLTALLNKWRIRREAAEGM